MLDSMFLLIPLSLLFVLFIAVALWWAVFSGQFEDANKAGESILQDDDSTGVDEK
ncbi:cbb3-type cytochrome oxidase assembly protein CcoS [Paenalcaligenes hermetiae]|uniref:Cbb3-type cytochrome oxidase assembly protein CcoS n=1 Tax=Paenalcaligenes hermetiae TaxID=1157987 RepID=A0ABP9LXT3_9BURK